MNDECWISDTEMLSMQGKDKNVTRLGSFGVALFAIGLNTALMHAVDRPPSLVVAIISIVIGLVAMSVAGIREG